MEQVDIKKRLRLSQLLAGVAIVLYLVSYTGGVFLEYRDPGTGELELDEDNLSFQPLTFFIPEEERKERNVSPDLVPYLGETIYEYVPTGYWAYVAGYNTMPTWRVSLEAPQYPKDTYPDGIPVLFTLTDFKGKVVEMNVINHYIGMDPMDVGAYHLRKWVPFIYLGFMLMISAFMFYNGPGWWILGLAPALMAWYYLGVYSYWLYWFGHNLHDYGAFTIKPFMPTVLGDGKVAQFVTHSYPAPGFYVLLGIFLSLGLSILIKRRALKDQSAQ